MSGVDLDAARALLLNAATPGPWFPGGDTLSDDLWIENRRADVVCTLNGQKGEERDAALIAAAPTLIAALCDEVERLRRALTVSACNRLPGPDGQDYADRAALIADWISDGAEFDQLAGITSWEDVERRVEDDR